MWSPVSMECACVCSTISLFTLHHNLIVVFNYFEISLVWLENVVTRTIHRLRWYDRVVNTDLWINTGTHDDLGQEEKMNGGLVRHNRRTQLSITDKHSSGTLTEMKKGAPQADSFLE
uniref:Uncharacterized protein n=1 Tax=Arion vulgaris TaxID=1028688 RepID=A0A0B7B5P3_9EUPU